MPILAISSHAQAQSTNLTLYGLVDTTVEFLQLGNGLTTRMDSGALNGSRFGMRGTEDIGGGDQIQFALEQGFSSATGMPSNPALAFSRQAWVGLASSWGSLRVGLQNSPVYIPLTAALDAFTVNTLASGFDSFMSITPRQGNAISYHSPDLNGLTGQVMVVLRDRNTAMKNGIGSYHLALELNKLSFSYVLGYQHVESADAKSVLDSLFTGGFYSFGSLRVHIGYNNSKSTATFNKEAFALSASYQLTPASRLSVGVAHAHDRSGMGKDANQVGLMYWYFLSKRTTLYASAGYLANSENASYTLTGFPGGVPVAHPGARARGVQIGIQHKF